MPSPESFLDLLRSRRSIRRFQPRPVEAEKLQRLCEALLRAPSSRGRNSWEFIVVQDAVMLRRLGAAKQHGSALLAEAPLAIVIAADPEVSDVWVEDSAIAAMLLQLEALELGLGSCWVQTRLRSHDPQTSSEGYLRELLGVPERFGIVCVVGLGYPAEQKRGHADDSLLREKLHLERYGQPQR